MAPMARPAAMPSQSIGQIGMNPCATIPPATAASAMAAGRDRTADRSRSRNGCRVTGPVGVGFVVGIASTNEKARCFQRACRSVAWKGSAKP